MEEWTRWEPIQGLDGNYSLDSFSWSKTGFVIELISGKQEKKYKFYSIIMLMHIDIPMKVFI